MPIFDEFINPNVGRDLFTAPGPSDSPLSGDFGFGTPAAPSGGITMHMGSGNAPGLPGSGDSYAPPVGIADSGQSGQDGFARFQEIMRTVLPMLAALGAYRQHALGSFTGGMMQGQEHQHQLAMDEQAQQDRIAEQQYRRDTQDRLGRAEQRAEDAVRAKAAKDEADAKLAEQEKIVQKIKAALAPFEENPLYGEGIPADVANSMAIDVPGVGRISLPEAFKRVGVMTDAEGKFHYGKVKEKTREPREPLVTDPSGTRVPDKPGQKVRVPPSRQPAQATRSHYTWTDDDPESATFGKSYRIVEDADGNVIKKTLITGASASEGGLLPEPPNSSPAPKKKVTITSIRQLP